MEDIKNMGFEDQNHYFIDNLMNQEARKQKETWPVLEESKVSSLREKFNRRNICSCGFTGIHREPIQGYFPHTGGFEIDGIKWWLFIVCPKCDFAWSLQKLIDFNLEKEKRDELRLDFVKKRIQLWMRQVTSKLCSNQDCSKCALQVKNQCVQGLIRELIREV